jgi:prephenate dehydrogenase
MKFETITIIGLGLIGGSLARALKESGQIGTVSGVDTDRDTIDYALKNKIIDEGFTKSGEAVRGAEIIVIATHVGAIKKTAEEIISDASEGSVITDVGSVKGKIVKEIESILPSRLSFVGGHPIAGTENSGVGASDPSLFRGKRFIITPTANTDPAAKDKVESLWKLTGSQIHEMDAEAHDRIFGLVSHLPHVVAYSLIDAIISEDDSDTLLSFAGSGLGDYTRVAASSPAMWTDIFKANKDEILRAMGKFKASLDKIEYLLEREEWESLLDMLSKSSEAKRKKGGE